MNESLKQALMDLFGPRFVEDARGVTVAPQNERELGALLRLLRERQGRQHDGLRISRQHFSSVGAVDVKSAVVQVGGGVKLERLEQDLRLRDVSLGPLSPGMLALDVAEWVEGPYAGLRAVAGGRLETSTLALTALMPDGLRFVSHPSPRSAAGPELDALIVGAEGRFAVLTAATLRLFGRPRAERTAVYSFPNLAALVTALRRAVAGGVWLKRARVEPHGERPLLACDVIGSAEGVERDLSTLGHEVFAQAGRSSGQAVAFEEGAPEERELTWDDLRAALEQGRAVTLYRLSLETLIASGAGEAGMPLSWGAGWANAEALQKVAAAADPDGILGGIP